MALVATVVKTTRDETVQILLASVDRKSCCGVGFADPTTTLKLSRDVYVFDLLSLIDKGIVILVMRVICANLPKYFSRLLLLNYAT